MSLIGFIVVGYILGRIWKEWDEERARRVQRDQSTLHRHPWPDGGTIIEHDHPYNSDHYHRVDFGGQFVSEPFLGPSPAGTWQVEDGNNGSWRSDTAW